MQAKEIKQRKPVEGRELKDGRKDAEQLYKITFYRAFNGRLNNFIIKAKPNSVIEAPLYVKNWLKKFKDFDGKPFSDA